MNASSKIIIASVGLLACIAIGVSGFVLGNTQSSETTHVLAALVEQTPTPTPSATKPSRAQRKANKQATKLRRQHGVGLFGSIDKIDGQTVSVTGRRGREESFTVGDQTKLVLVGKANATVSDLVVGDKVLVLGLRDKGQKNAAFTPRVVIAVPANYNRANVVAGRAEIISANQLQTKTKNGDESVTLSSDTQILGPNLTSEPASDLKNKTAVLVLGTPSGNNALIAQVIIALKAGKSHLNKNGAPKTPKAKPTPGTV
jgi:hypothetical protein